ncbi:MAG: hypothetical protein OEY59_08050 [Deltaproteobacteria bacterium]|nr:hypothetical protein [Deltaproteobacteria bacterium]
MLIKGQAQHLAEFMVQLSQKLHQEEWCFGLEFELWSEITEEQEFLENDEINKLHKLSAQCEGWVYMNYQTSQLEFLPLASWKIKFRDNKPF